MEGHSTSNRGSSAAADEYLEQQRRKQHTAGSKHKRSMNRRRHVPGTVKHSKVVTTIRLRCCESWAATRIRPVCVNHCKLLMLGQAHWPLDVISVHMHLPQHFVLLATQQRGPCVSHQSPGEEPLQSRPSRNNVEGAGCGHHHQTPSTRQLLLLNATDGPAWQNIGQGSARSETAAL